MSDLAATNCGCDCNSGGSCNGGCGCGNMIWPLLLFSCCGNNSCGCDQGCGGSCSDWIWLYLLCSCGGCGGGRPFC